MGKHLAPAFGWRQTSSASWAYFYARPENPVQGKSEYEQSPYSQA
jgi:hypothetical protein